MVEAEVVPAEHACKTDKIGAGKAWSPCTRHLYVRNPVGDAVRVCVDFDADVRTLSSAFASRECLPKASMAEASLKFIFHGWELEPGVPLRSYGLTPGSTISTILRTQVATFCISDQTTIDSSDVIAELVRMPVQFTTPFVVVDATLEIPADYWATSKISAKRLSQCYCLSERVAISSKARSWENYWCLRLLTVREFPCSQNTPLLDVFDRLQDALARITVHGPAEWTNPGSTSLLLNGDDEVCLGAIADADHISDVRFSISLLNDVERGIDDATSLFCEKDAACLGADCEACCVCLERISPGDMCRRMPCLHRLHAGCAMKLLTKKPRCPICRSDIAMKTQICAAKPTVSSARSAARAQSRTPPRPPRAAAQAAPDPERRRTNETPIEPPQSTSVGDVADGREHASPLTTVKRVLSLGLKTLRSRSWSASRRGRVRPQQEL